MIVVFRSILQAGASSVTDVAASAAARGEEAGAEAALVQLPQAAEEQELLMPFGEKLKQPSAAVKVGHAGISYSISQLCCECCPRINPTSSIIECHARISAASSIIECHARINPISSIIECHTEINSTSLNWLVQI
jgi:hypothetical protein